MCVCVYFGSEGLGFRVLGPLKGSGIQRCRVGSRGAVNPVAYVHLKLLLQIPGKLH